MVDIGSKTHQRNVVSPTFLNMPLDVAKLVLEKLELKDLLRASRVCRSLRTAVDTFGTIRVNDVEFRLNDHDICMDLDVGRIRINYTDSAKDSSNVNYNEQKKETDEENFMESAVKDLKIIAKHARSIDISDCTKNRRDTLKNFIEFLKLEKCNHVKIIDLSCSSFDDVLAILPCIDVKELKEISLFIQSIDQFERISRLEQWRNAEVFRCGYASIPSTMIAHFFHFEFFDIDMDEFSSQAAIQMRDDLLRRSTFQSCEIKVKKSERNPIELAKVFKPDYARGNEFNIEYSNGNNKFNISLKDLSRIYSKFIVKRL